MDTGDSDVPAQDWQSLTTSAIIAADRFAKELERCFSEVAIDDNNRELVESARATAESFRKNAAGMARSSALWN